MLARKSTTIKAIQACKERVINKSGHILPDDERIRVLKHVLETGRPATVVKGENFRRVVLD